MKNVLIAVIITGFIAGISLTQQARGQDKVAVAPQNTVKEHTLQAFEIDKSRLLSGDNVCPPYFLWTTLGGRVNPGLRFQFLDEGPPRRVRVQLVPLERVNILIDAKKDVPTASKDEDSEGKLVWTIRMDTKVLEAAKDCLPDKVFLREPNK